VTSLVSFVPKNLDGVLEILVMMVLFGVEVFFIKSYWN
jgi:hypothetical protein